MLGPVVTMRENSCDSGSDSDGDDLSGSEAGSGSDAGSNSDSDNSKNAPDNEGNSDDSKAASNSDSGSSGSGSGSGSESSSGSDNESGSDSAKDGNNDEIQGSNDDERNESFNSSRASSHSKSSSSSSKSGKDVLKKCWEKDPDIYGIRRSGRERKQPERIAIENKERSIKKQRRPSAGQWNSSDESMSDGSDDSDSASRRRPPAKKAIKKKIVSRRNSNEYNKKATRTVRTVGNKVSYKEASEDENDDEDLVEVDWSQTEKEDENVQTIEKMITHRIGKKGAVGMQTYVYEIDKNGDPNSDFNPNDPSQTEMQFLVKWKGWAHIHNTWESEESIKTQKVKGCKKLENYLRKEEEINIWKRRATPEEVEYMEIQAEMERDLYTSHLTAERIFAEAIENGNTYFYVKWQNLPYSEATWELEEIVTTRYPTQLKEFRDRENSSCFPKQCPALKHRPKFSPIKLQPDFIGGESEDFTLRDYQLDGLNWLIHSWCKHNSVILADEMGLGKTIQTIAFLSYLFHVHHLYGPFLLVLPLSTLIAWQREFAQWAPDMNVIVYIGDRDSRRIIQEYEYTFASKRIKFNAVLTTYEILLRDKEVLQDSCQWAALVIDEAHRLKNEDSQLYQALCDFKTNHRLLITGTPLQNSLKELWALLHFIMPEKFNDWEYFDSQHNGEDMKKGFHRLHKQLEPYLLRRVKKDVEKSLPAKVEQILRVDMAQLQKQYYKWILTKNYEMLKKGNRGSTSGFVNIVMELKKCCNHAFLTKPNDDPYNNQQDLVLQLLRGSGKLMLLDKLLVRLNETGHRVLIFSQMVRMLDILAHYLQLRRFPFQRLDGSINGELRRQALDHFNAEGSNDFCFLLSTRAGGLGINLATADTVIIFDSDWNPQNDLQAQARAHRIGQKNQVNIYRLVTKNSIEETIIERAKKKMVLDHLVIQSMDTSGRTVFNKKMSNSSTPFNKEELNAILKFGAEELFKDDDENEEEPMCDIDEILRRAETRDEGPASAGDELLSAFKVASFNIDEDEEVSKLGSTVDENTTDWDEIIPEKFRSQIADEEKQKEIADLYLPPRKRKTMNQDDKEEAESSAKRMKKESESSDDDGEASDEDRPKRRGRPRMYQKETVKGFTDPEVRRFFKSFKKFSNPLCRLDVIAIDADMREKSKEDLERLGRTIIERCRDALAEHEAALQNAKTESTDNSVKKQKKDRGPSFRLSGVAINAKSTLTIIDEMSPLDRVVPNAPVERASWVLPLKKVKDAHWDVPWGIPEDSRLLRGIYEYGIGSWEQLKGDPALNLGEKILLEGDMKPQAKHLENRAQYLLKILRKTVVVTENKSVKKTAKPKIRKMKEPKGISKEIIENDDTSDEENPSSTHAASLPAKKIHKDEKKIVQKEIKGEERAEEGDKVRVKEENTHKDKKKKKRDKKERTPQGPLHITANGEPTPLDSTQELDQNHPLWAECKEKMRPMKKALKALDNPNKSLSQEEQIQHTRKCLIQIGDHIEKTLNQHQDHDTFKEWKNLLWQFVSKFTEYDAKKLHKLYKKHKKLIDEKKDGSTKEGKADKKDKKKDRKDDDKHHHSSKRKHEDDFNSQNKNSYNGLAANANNDRGRDVGNQRQDNWRDRDGIPHRESRDRSGERNYQPRNHGVGMNRDWHPSSTNRESRYPQDFKRDGYHREPFNTHGYHRGHSDWGGRPPHHPPHLKHQGGYGVPHGGPNYPPARYPQIRPMGYGGGMMGGRPPLPYSQQSHRSPEWGSKGRPMDRSDWSSPKEGGGPERGSKPDWPNKDPRQEAQRRDRAKPYPPQSHVN